MSIIFDGRLHRILASWAKQLLIAARRTQDLPLCQMCALVQVSTPASRHVWCGFITLSLARAALHPSSLGLVIVVVAVVAASSTAAAFVVAVVVAVVWYPR